jgi:thymidylate kinase
MHPPEPSFDPYRKGLEALDLPRFAARDSDAPFIVAIEGPNGVGKSTLVGALAGSLEAPCCLGVDPAWFAESFKARMIRDADWFASGMFFLSGCFEQMRVLRESRVPLAIMDRSIWSTLAVHAAEKVQRLEAMLTMLRPIAAGVRVPDFTLVLEASFETCQDRISHKQGNSRALDELTATQTFHSRERDFYRWLGDRAPGVTFLNVDALSAAEAFAASREILRDLKLTGSQVRG